MKSTSVAEWLERQFLNDDRGDEWTVFCLSRLYNRHTMIHTKKHSWCTIEEGGNWDYEGACDTHLLYMGNNMYGELLPKSVTWLNLIPNLLVSTPPLPPQQPSQQTENVDEPTPTEVTSQQPESAEFPNSIPDQDPMHVTPTCDVLEETKYDSNLDQMLMQSTKTDNGKSCPVHPHCSTSESSSKPSKQTLETSTTLAILKCACNVNLQKLMDLDIKKMD